MRPSKVHALASILLIVHVNKFGKLARKQRKRIDFMDHIGCRDLDFCEPEWLCKLRDRRSIHGIISSSVESSEDSYGAAEVI